MINATDLIAKLLANEDVNVVHAPVQTASFDIQSRTLTLPTWKEASNDLIGMLVGHEVGHALWTGMEYLEHDLANQRAFQGYLNVLEDVRIEKLMKRRYPGIRKTFNAGYKELNERDFFGINGKDLNRMLLIDRINLYFKAGYLCGVTFTKDEMEIVKEAENTETIQDVLELAKKIYTMTKEELEDAIQQQQQIMVQEAADGTSGDSDADDLDDMGQTLGSPMSGYDSTPQIQDPDQKLQSLLESKTERAFSERMKELADVNTVYTYVGLGEFLYEPFIPYKQVIAHCKKYKEKNKDYFDRSNNESRIKHLETFKQGSSQVVNYLIKEFEMKKAATNFKRAQISKTGQLDTRKLYAYKLKDDVFRRITTVKDGKKHGMVFLLDWSGSMSNVIRETLEQVVNLAMFCRKAQIPFQVISFGAHFHNESYDLRPRVAIEEQTKQDMMLVNSDDLSLLELFSHKMSNSEFNYMLDNLVTFGQSLITLGNTPLNETLVYMDKHLAKFKSENNVEKLTFITLTDGDGHQLRVGGRDKEYEDNYRTNQRKKYRYFITSSKKKTYDMSHYNQTASLLNLLKDNHDMTVVGFYLTNTSSNALYGVLRSNYSELPPNEYEMINDMKKQMKEKGFASLKGTGRDDLFIVPLRNTKIEETTIDSVDGNASVAAIARQFGKMFKRRKTSRILLDKFIDYVA